MLTLQEYSITMCAKVTWRNIFNCISLFNISNYLEGVRDVLTLQEYSVLHLSGSSGVGSVVWAAVISKTTK